jgi:hypothetical protein
MRIFERDKISKPSKRFIFIVKFDIVDILNQGNRNFHLPSMHHDTRRARLYVKQTPFSRKTLDITQGVRDSNTDFNNMFSWFFSIIQTEC